VLEFGKLFLFLEVEMFGHWVGVLLCDRLRRQPAIVVRACSRY
jgi:hypothetical protein